jgi:hypothetical protein
LRDAAGQRWNFCDRHSILVLFNQNPVFHLLITSHDKYPTTNLRSNPAKRALL